MSIHLIHATQANGIPLRTGKKERKFKMLFLDIGLFQRAMQIDSQEVLDRDLLDIHEGTLAEHFVGQELLAYTDFFEDRYLYFWEREKKSSSAELDYVFNISSRVIPIEVKAGKTGRLRSLKQFMSEKDLNLGIRISQAPLSLNEKILSVPFYMISEISRLI
ncbi:hypothetical protein SCG7109_AF_00050 [Chlamydiales bacterium SCGC AG-110-M15]|nr:hypothetical protein SCG7109_AF_00050 [Chlamydiales bacterium SCGC AG-110-M15]